MRSAAPPPGAPRLIDMTWGDPARAQGDAGRQGRVLRHRRARHQARQRHAADEEGHGRRRQRAGARPHGHGPRSSTCGCACSSRRSRIPSPATRSGRSTSTARARACRSRSATPTPKGRLILADALALADEETPDLLVDMGTLTGAARVALGPDLPPFYTDDDALAGGCRAPCAAPRTTRCGGCRCGGPTTAMLDSKVADIEQYRHRRLRRLDHLRAVPQPLRRRRQGVAASRHLCLDAVRQARAGPKAANARLRARSMRS